jgi:glycosyltransferase involved in cell wall biosynthesis
MAGFDRLTIDNSVITVWRRTAIGKSPDPRRRRGASAAWKCLGRHVASMKILVVADFFPWPPLNGGLLRLATTIEALSELGTVDLFSFVDERQKDRTVPRHVSLGRLETVSHPAIDRSNRWRAAWLARRGVPMEVVMRQADAAPRRKFAAFVTGRRYDLAWFRWPMPFAWLGRPHPGPTVVDLDGLAGEGEQERAALMTVASSSRLDTHRLRASLAKVQARINARDWREFQHAVAGQVDRVVFCSDAEVRRSGMPNAELVINTYPRPSVPLGRKAPGDPPVVLFQGTFDYGPNADGATWFVREISPRLRAQVPGTIVRLVGKTSPAVEQLDDPPAVTTVGVIPSMGPELARADLAVVPIRYGSGTRLKILESFAHRVPVVSTTLGAAGLEVDNGVHLLLADDPDQFAHACQRVLTDIGLRTRLVAAAEQLYLEHYESCVARQQIRSIVSDLIGQAPAPR